MIAKSLAKRGVLNTVLYATQWPLIIYRERQSLLERNAIQSQFDRLHGTDTAGIIPLSSFVIEDPAWPHGVRYAPTSPQGFEASLSLLGLNSKSYNDFTFVDVGSGKGATLLYASHLGFKAVYGIELVKELHDIAARNLSLYLPDGDRGKSICANAANFQMPAPPLLVFANYPFSSKELMAAVVQNIANSGKGPKYLVADNFPYDPATLPCARLRLIRGVRASTGNNNYAFEVL
jgi:SAM-dependent methyltransferase